jgi:hypothetical protein
MQLKNNSQWQVHRNFHSIHLYWHGGSGQIVSWWKARDLFWAMVEPIAGSECSFNDGFKTGRRWRMFF